jgi:hypothetical protein
MQTMKYSQTDSDAGGSAIWFLTVFILMWDSMVFGFVVPARNMPFWFKAVFVGMGLLVTVATFFAWRNRILGGSAKLQLSADPVPHGVQVTAKFELAKAIKATHWSIEAKLEHERKGSESYSTLWSQTFPAQLTSLQMATATFVFPSDYSPKNMTETGTSYRRILTLTADKLRWEFLLEPEMPAAVS